MSSSSQDSSTILLKQMFDPSKEYTFLVGAGISMNAPSNIPSAVQFVKSILTLCAPPEEINFILSLRHLRYELLIEKFKIFFDKDLHFLDYLELVQDPNLIHFFLASAIVQHQMVMTTNFDFLIERALQHILFQGDHGKIIPVITRKDFEHHLRPLDTIEAGFYPLYKIHGSKKNLITGEMTVNSLITTMGSLGKDRAMGETFSLEEYKQQPFYNMVKGRTLIIMGYSGSDDFDIGPMLRMLPRVEQLIWIEHSFDPQTSIHKIGHPSPANSTTKPLPSTLLLEDIYHHRAMPIYQLFTNTQDFIQHELWDLILPDFPLTKSEFTAHSDPLPDFHTWLTHEFHKKLPNTEEKYLFACSLFADFKKWDALARCAEKGLKEAITNSNTRTQMHFLNYLGMALAAIDKFYDALKKYQEGMDLAEKVEDWEFYAIFLTNVGVISNQLRYAMPEDQLSVTEWMFEQSLQLFETNQNQWGKIACLTNLAGIDFFKGEYLQANKNLADAYSQIQHIGNLSYKANITYNFGIICEYMMTEQDTLSKYQEGITINTLLGNHSGSIQGNIHLIQYHLNQGETQKAETYFETAMVLAKDQQISAYLPELHEWKGWIHYYKGELEEAERSLQHASRLYDQEKQHDIDLVILWQIQTQADQAYIYFHHHKLTEAQESWQEAKTLLEKIPRESPTLQRIYQQITQNLAILQIIFNKELEGKMEVGQTYSESEIFPLLSDLSQAQNTVEEKVAYLEQILAGSINLTPNLNPAVQDPDPNSNPNPDPDPFKPRVHAQSLALLDLGYLNLISGEIKNAYSYFERANDTFSRLELFSTLDLLLPHFQTLHVVSKTLRISRHPYFFLQYDERDIAQEDLSWMASWRSRNQSTEAFQIMKNGYQAFEETRYQEAENLFKQAYAMFETLGEKEQMAEIEETIITVQALQVAGGRPIEEVAGDNPEIAKKIYYYIKEVISGNNPFEKLPKVPNGDGKDTESLLQGSFNQDIIHSAQYLIEIEDRGRSQVLEQEHPEGALKTFFQLDAILELGEKRQDMEPLGKMEILFSQAQILTAHHEYQLAEGRLNEAYHISIVYGAEGKALQAKIAKQYGVLHQCQKKFEEAFRFLEQALRLYEVLQDAPQMVDTLNIIGVVCEQMGKPKKARFYYDQAEYLPLTFETKKTIAEIAVRNVKINQNVGNYPKAFTLIQKAIQIFQETQEFPPIAAPAFFIAGQMYTIANNITAAISVYQKAQELYAATQDPTYTTLLPKKIQELQENPPNIEKLLEVTFLQAEKLWESEEPLENIQKDYQKCFFIATRLDKPEYQLQCTYNIGLIYWLEGIPSQAKTYFEQALQFVEACTNTDQFTEIIEDCQAKIAQLATKELIIHFFQDEVQETYKIENYSAVTPKAQKLGNLFRLNGKIPELISNLTFQTRLYLYNLKQYEKAENFGLVAYDLSKEGAYEELLIDISRVLCDVYFYLKKPEKQISYAEQCLHYYQKLANEKDMLVFIEILAYNYRDTYQYEAAHPLFEQGLEIIKKFDIVDKLVNYYFNLGFIYNRLNYLPKSIEYYERGIEIAQNQQNTMFQQVFYINLIQAYGYQGNYKKAEQYAQQAEKLYETVKNDEYLAQCYLEWAIILELQGKFHKALQKSKAAYELFSQLNLQIEIWQTQLMNDWYLLHLKKIKTSPLLSENFEDQLTKMEDKEEIPFLFSLLADLYSRMRNPQKADHYYQKSLELCKKFGLGSFAPYILYRWGKMYLQEGQIQKGNSKLKEALPMFEQMQQQEKIKEIKKRVHIR